MANRREFVQGALGGLSAGLIGTSLFSAAAAATETSCRMIRYGEEVVDAAVWASWYDLPAGSEATFNDWLHTTHLPRLLQRPGHLWVAHYSLAPWAAEDMGQLSRQLQVKPGNAPGVGRGESWLVLVGADGAPPFVMQTNEQLDGAVTDRDRKMLALRQGLHSDVYLDLVKVSGPASTLRKPGTAPGPRVQLGAYRVAEGREEDLWNGYFGRRLPYVEQMPGAVSCRVMRGLRGWPTFAVLYEFADEAAAARFQVDGERGEHGEEAMLNAPGRPDVRDFVVQAPGSPFLGDRQWSRSR